MSGTSHGIDEPIWQRVESQKVFLMPPAVMLKHRVYRKEQFQKIMMLSEDLFTRRHPSVSYDKVEALRMYLRVLVGMDDDQERASLMNELCSRLPNIRRKYILRYMRETYQRVFETEVPVFKHIDFPSEDLMLVSFDMLPSGVFYDPTMHCRVKRVGSSAAKSNALQYHDIEKDGIDSNNHFFAGHELETNAIKSVIEQVLKHHGTMQESHKFSWHLSYLLSAFTEEQDPHIDYKHKTVEAAKRRYSARHKVSIDELDWMVNWSMDMPLTAGGMYLNVWGRNLDPSKVYYPVNILVPFRSCLLWRGDIVHGGVFLDEKKGSAYRVHAYIPVCIAMDYAHIDGNSVTFELNDERNKKFADYCKFKGRRL